MTPARAMHILLIEDNESDVFFFREALREASLVVDLTICRRGDTVEETLRQTEREKHLPTLIVVDLNLPRMGGQDLMQAIRAIEACAAIPIVVLSSSEARSDVRASYCNGASAYLVKPLDYEVLKEMVTSMVTFWSRVTFAPR